VNRRAFLLAGTGAIALGVAAPYAPLPFGDNFEDLVADTLGMDPAVAAGLLDRVREQLGDTEYDARAWTFAIACRWPWAGVLPEGVRRSGLERLLSPLFDEPPDRLAYIENRAPGGACAGLRRPT
jgi:hypothetical protein